MNKKIVHVFMAFFLLLFAPVMFLSGCGENSPEETVIFHATDIHYISQTLTDNSQRFIDMLYEGDGKVIQYIDQITDAFVSEVKEKRPDVLLLGGDVTFNGEKQSHIDFAAKLKEIEKNGTDVLIIPGNHDIDYPFSYRYEGDNYYLTDRITKEDWEDIYGDFGLKEAYSRDTDSLSYFYKVNNKVTVLALDSGNIFYPYFSDETLRWIEEELEKIEEGVTVISLSHQSLADHFTGTSFRNEYTVLNGQRAVDILNKYGVKLNLSGHIHRQDVYRDEGGLTDIATGSMAVLDNPYGEIICTDDMIKYARKSTDVEEWAARNGVTDENLLNFTQYSRDFFTGSTKAKFLGRFMQSGDVSQEDREAAAEYIAAFNAAYFSGNLYSEYEEIKKLPGYDVLHSPDGIYGGEYNNFIEENKTGVNLRECEINLRK